MPIRRDQTFYPSWSPRGVRKHRFGSVPQAFPVLPDPTTSSFWSALKLLGIDPDPQFNLGGQLSGGGGAFPQTTCAPCYVWNDSTQQCEKITGCVPGSNTGGGTDSGVSDSGQCQDIGGAVWDSTTHQCECEHDWQKMNAEGTECVDNRPSPECTNPEHIRVDGTCRPCRIEDVARANTCAAQDKGSGATNDGVPQVQNRNGTCVEVDCNSKTGAGGDPPRVSSYQCGPTGQDRYKNPDGTPGEPILNTHFASGRCPDDPDNTISPGGFTGDVDRGPAAPLGSYTPVGTEGEDRCSDRSYAYQNPTICGPQSGEGTIEGYWAKEQEGCEARGGFWDRFVEAGSLNPGGYALDGSGVCREFGMATWESAQQQCPEGGYPRDYPDGRCPVQRRTAPGMASGDATPQPEQVESLGHIASGFQSQMSPVLDIQRRTAPSKQCGPSTTPRNNTCASQGLPSARGGAQYEERNGTCYEVGCGY